MASDPYDKNGPFKTYDLFLHQRSMHLTRRRLVENLDSIYDRTRAKGFSLPGEPPGIHLRSFALTVLDKTMRFVDDQLSNRGAVLSKPEHRAYLVTLRHQYESVCDQRDRWRREDIAGFGPVTW